MLDFRPLFLTLLVIAAAFVILLRVLWKSKRWMALASVCWITVGPSSLSVAADLIGQALLGNRNAPLEARVPAGIVVMSITLALLWVRDRRCARIMWWLCLLLSGTWMLDAVSRWRTGGYNAFGALLGPGLAIALLALTAYAIRRMWPPEARLHYERAFE